MMLVGIGVWVGIGLLSFPKVFAKMSEHAPSRLNDLLSAFTICAICGIFASLIYRK